MSRCRSTYEVDIAVFVVYLNWRILDKIKEPSSRLRVVWSQLWKLTDLSTKIVISTQRTPFNKYKYHVQIVQNFWFFLLQKTAQLFDLLIMSVKVTVIPDSFWVHYIRYLRFNSQAWNTNRNIIHLLIILRNKSLFQIRTNMVWSSKMLCLQIWTACNYRWSNC